jgi:hypothetical protein
MEEAWGNRAPEASPEAGECTIKSLALRLRAEGKGDAFRGLGNSFWQIDLPVALALVHLKNNGCFTRRVVVGSFDEEKIGTHLGASDGFAIDDQLHLHPG